MLWGRTPCRAHKAHCTSRNLGVPGWGSCGCCGPGDTVGLGGDAVGLGGLAVGCTGPLHLQVLGGARTGTLWGGDTVGWGRGTPRGRTHCRARSRTAPPGTCTSPGRGRGRRRSRPPPRTASGCCTCAGTGDVRHGAGDTGDTAQHRGGDLGPEDVSRGQGMWGHGRCPWGGPACAVGT